MELNEHNVLGRLGFCVKDGTVETDKPEAARGSYGTSRLGLVAEPDLADPPYGASGKPATAYPPKPQPSVATEPLRAQPIPQPTRTRPGRGAEPAATSPANRTPSHHLVPVVPYPHPTYSGDCGIGLWAVPCRRRHSAPARPRAYRRGTFKLPYDLLQKLRFCANRLDTYQYKLVTRALQEFLDHLIEEVPDRQS
jgi:hypothetical protein